MRIVCISDTHNRTRGLVVPDGEVLIHAGDLTEDGGFDQAVTFIDWFASPPHPLKVFIAGNHDHVFQRIPEAIEPLLQAYPGVTYLKDSGVEFDGLRLWGTPWSPPMVEDMRDEDWAFRRRRGSRLAETWSWIPADTDVLITHCPPHRVLDRTFDGLHVGCGALAKRVKVLKPILHVFGHIHFGYGVKTLERTTFVNACTCGEDYRPTNPPIVVDLP